MSEHWKVVAFIALIWISGIAVGFWSIWRMKKDWKQETPDEHR